MDQFLSFKTSMPVGCLLSLGYITSEMNDTVCLKGLNSDDIDEPL